MRVLLLGLGWKSTFLALFILLLRSLLLLTSFLLHILTDFIASLVTDFIRAIGGLTPDFGLGLPFCLLREEDAVFWLYSGSVNKDRFNSGCPKKQVNPKLSEVNPKLKIWVCKILASLSV